MVIRRERSELREAARRGGSGSLRVALISVHASPLAVLGSKDSGGMNVYIRELSRQLGRRGIAVDIFTHRRDPAVPQIVPLGPRTRVIHLKAGPVANLDKRALERELPSFTTSSSGFGTITAWTTI